MDVNHTYLYIPMLQMYAFMLAAAGMDPDIIWKDLHHLVRLRHYDVAGCAFGIL